MKPRTHACADCPEIITAKSTRCRGCATRRVNASPEVAAARAAGIRAKFTDPAHLAKMQRVAKRNGETARADPAFRARLVEHGKRQRAGSLGTPQARAAYLASRPASGRKRTETVLGWCPPEYRDEYRRLNRSKYIPAAQAKQMILDMIEAERAKPAKLSPFERQERAMRNGAPLVANAALYRDVR